MYFNLAREKDRKRILGTLLTNIENHKNHLSTGFVGTPYICHTLSENGAHDMAAALFMLQLFYPIRLSHPENMHTKIPLLRYLAIRLQSNSLLTCHVFSNGKHGLSLANEAWAKGEYGTTDTMAQTNGVLQAIRQGVLDIPEPARSQLLEAFDYSGEKGEEMLNANIPNEEVAIWPLLADQWLKKLGRDQTGNDLFHK